MSKQQGSSRGRGRFSDEELAWMAANLPRVRRWIAGEGILYWDLSFAFVLGLAAHIGGYFLRHYTIGEVLPLVADLVSALGTALWTGVVLVVSVQVLPEAKRRAAARALEDYEAALAERAAWSEPNSTEEGPPRQK